MNLWKYAFALLAVVGTAACSQFDDNSHTDSGEQPVMTYTGIFLYGGYTLPAEEYLPMPDFIKQLGTSSYGADTTIATHAVSPVLKERFVLDITDTEGVLNNVESREETRTYCTIRPKIINFKEGVHEFGDIKVTITGDAILVEGHGREPYTIALDDYKYTDKLDCITLDLQKQVDTLESFHRAIGRINDCGELYLSASDTTYHCTGIGRETIRLTRLSPPGEESWELELQCPQM